MSLAFFDGNNFMYENTPKILWIDGKIWGQQKVYIVQECLITL